MSARPRYRVGIDVGGTFTHAVAIDSESLKLIGRVKVPTSHRSAHGVGEGVVQSLRLLMTKAEIAPEQVVFVAHSTTQATNSLLEGDVEKVAIISTGRGLQGWLTKRGAHLPKIPLSPGRFLESVSFHANPDDPDLENRLVSFLNSARESGIRIAVVTGPFSVENPADEITLAEFVRAQGFLCTATHEVSQLYGVRIRTRTTAINASILPKMMEVANLTEQGIRELGISAPLMIMRSDGGVMTVEEMQKKPILTLLSGPAAGIAAALRYLKITDGVFLEVGGTSTDLSVIRNGRAVIRSASIGGQKTFLKTLDCRTLGVGGGSVPRSSEETVREVGPRSAHIAQVDYASFRSGSLTDPEWSRLKATHVTPKEGDPADYLVFVDPENPFTRIAFTPTCASNALGLVSENDCSRATTGFPGRWDEVLTRSELGGLEAFSKNILEASSRKIQETVEKLLKEYRLKASWTSLIGGGGGASSVVPHLAKSMGMTFQIAEENDVISAIGVALGMIRETVDKSVIDPKPEDIYLLREEARARVSDQGASADSIEVFIEVDAKRNIIRAEAQGSIEFGNRIELAPSENELHDQALLQVAQGALGLTRNARLEKRAGSQRLVAAEISEPRRKLFGIFERESRYTVVVDSRGIVRLRLEDAHLLPTSAGAVVSDLDRHLESHTLYGDGGVTYPYLYCLLGDRVVDLSKLQNPSHFTSVLEMETRDAPRDEPAVLIFTQKGTEE